VLESQRKTARAAAPVNREVRPPRPHAPSPEEKAAHEAMLEKLSDPLWRT
jgi:DNA polymerase-3 subunit epsilon